MHDAPGGGEVRHHDGQRLVGAVLAAAQFAHGGIAGRVAGQMEPAQPLHGGDAPGGQRGCQRPDGRGARGAVCVMIVVGSGAGRGRRGRFRCGALRRTVHVPHARSAHRTGVGLGVKAPVQRVFILCRALRAQRKAGHGGLVAVVGNEPGDGVARPAVGAVGEGVQVAAVARVVHVGQTVVAGGHVGADEHLVPGSSVAAGNYPESVLAFRHGHVLVRARDHSGQRRQLVGQVVPEAVHRCRKSLYFYEHPGGGVADRAGQRMVGGDAVHEGAKPHPLDLPGDGEFAAHEIVWHAATIAEDQRREKACGGGAPQPGTPCRIAPLAGVAAIARTASSFRWRPHALRQAPVWACCHEGVALIKCRNGRAASGEPGRLASAAWATPGGRGATGTRPACTRCAADLQWRAAVRARSRGYFPCTVCAGRISRTIPTAFLRRGLAGIRRGRAQSIRFKEEPWALTSLARACASTGKTAA
ncbi:hypothetical protein DSECCO2_581180 [anaerobic digester metagenome]